MENRERELFIFAVEEDLGQFNSACWRDAHITMMSRKGKGGGRKKTKATASTPPVHSPDFSDNNNRGTGDDDDDGFDDDIECACNID